MNTDNQTNHTVDITGAIIASLQRRMRQTQDGVSISVQGASNGELIPVNESPQDRRTLGAVKTTLHAVSEIEDPRGGTIEVANHTQSVDALVSVATLSRTATDQASQSDSANALQNASGAASSAVGQAPSEPDNDLDDGPSPA